MSNPQKNKGDRNEREAAALITDLLGYPVRRKLGAGRAEDTGDMHGIPDTVIQVAAWNDYAAAVRTKPLGAETQRVNAGCTYAATWVKFPRAGWRVVLTPQQWATYVFNSQEA